jgi:tetratricopeptide (TPR) repeat protein
MSVVGKWFGFASQELLDEGLLAFGRGAHELATEAFEACLELGEDSETTRLARFYLAESHSLWANQLSRLGDHMAASVSIGKALAINPHYPELHLMAAKIHRRLDRPEVMEHHLACALELNPNYTDALVFQGASQYERGDHDLGLETVRRACDLDPYLDRRCLDAARIYHLTGDQVRAAAALYAISSKRDAANLFRELGDMSMRANDFEQAVREYERGVDLAPIYPDLQCRLGKALLALGSVTEAEERFRAAIQLDPRNAEAHARLGLSLRAQSRHQEADREFRRALDLAPDHQIVWPEARRLAS